MQPSGDEQRRGRWCLALVIWRARRVLNAQEPQ